MVAASVLVVVVVTALAGTALALASAYGGIHRVTIVHAPPVAAGSPADPPSGPAPDPGLSSAMNILLTGSDGRACVDPNAPEAGAYMGGSTPAGDRSDTIMVLRLDPDHHSMGLLSLPRDLYVPIAGTKGKDRINAAFTAGDPNTLIQTIETDFGIRIDHYVGVDFCAFKSMVDAVGGIAIPFDAPARDTHTGLDVTAAGCQSLTGDEALAYVRSRHYTHQVNGRWVSDPTGDYGRIARQQDFARRLADKALAEGAASPTTAARLLGVARSSDVQIDDGLSLSDLLHIATSISDLGPDSTATYRLAGRAIVVNGADVIEPDLTSPASIAVLAYFRGPQPSATSGPTDTAPSITVSGRTTGTPAPAPPTGDTASIVPAADQTC